MKCRLFLCILILVLLLSGCSTPNYSGYTYECGDVWALGRLPEIFVSAKSKQNTFPVDAVTLDLFFSAYDCAYKSNRGVGNYGAREYLCIYVTSDEYFKSDNNENTTTDIENRENRYLLFKATDEGDIFTPEDGHTLERYSLFSEYVNYRRFETVTIPKELFAGDTGFFRFELILYAEHEEGTYTAYTWQDLRMDYTKNQDGTVTLNFD